jgi:hypothetical protein
MNPIIAKVEKMLRVARDQAGTPEGETAAALAHKYMRAHAVSMAEIDLDRQLAADPMIQRDVRTPVSIWRRILLDAVAVHCSCRSLYNSSGGIQIVHVYGHKTDVEVAEFLYAICERQIEAAARHYVAGLDEWWSRGDKRSMGNDFRRSAVRGLKVKLAELRKVDREADGTALVVARGDRVSAWVEDTVEYRNSTVAARNLNAEGWRAGQAVSLTAGVTGDNAPTPALEGA